MAQSPKVISSGVAVMDPNNSTNAIPNTLKVNSDGSINTNATVIVTAESTAEATAAAPAYSEGQDAPLSQNLSGALRVISNTTGSGTATGAIRVELPTNGTGVVGLNAGTAVIGQASPLTSSTMTATQVTVPSTANGIVILAANASRKGASISNPGSVSVYIQQGSTGVTTSNGYAITPGGAFNIDTPLYLGAIYGIVATGSQVVTVEEMT